MSLIYLLSKFSQEAMVLELFLISLLCLCLFGFFLFKRRRYGVAKNNISDQVVRAFLSEVLSISESFRLQLFGDTLKINPAIHGTSNLAATTEAAKALAETMVASGGADAAALRAQLSAAHAKIDELNKIIAQLMAEKAALEEKLKKSASAGATATAGAAAATDASDPGLKKELDDANEKIKALEARLAEYEVIEDDLANLKRYQQENKQLKAEIEMLRKGGAAPAAEAPALEAQAAAAPPAPAPQPKAVVEAAKPVADLIPEADIIASASSPIAEAEETRNEAIPEAKLDALATKVEESLAAASPTGASVTDPAATAAAKTAAPASDAAPLAAEDKTPEKADKSDADLLSEFEKMLSN